MKNFRSFNTEKLRATFDVKFQTTEVAEELSDC